MKVMKSFQRIESQHKPPVTLANAVSLTSTKTSSCSDRHYPASPANLGAALNPRYDRQMDGAPCLARYQAREWILPPNDEQQSFQWREMITIVDCCRTPIRTKPMSKRQCDHIFLSC